MIIGVPQEVKNNEFRVGLTPGNVSGLCKQGHSVLIQRGAGEQIGLSDESYRIAGATLINSAAEVFKKAEMIVKVKEPQPQECAMLREDQIYGDLPPNLDEVMQYDRYQPFRLITNRQGFRNVNSVTIDRSRQRVLAIGDSFTYGLHIDNHETWPAILEQLNPAREIINAGIPGHTITHERLIDSLTGEIPCTPEATAKVIVTSAISCRVS